MKNKLLFAAIFVAVVVLFHVSYGLRILVPTNVSWLMTAMHDWGTHYLGWYFYRNEAWQFPLGQVTNYFYPVGTNVGYTDSIPLLALFFKPFSGLLPEDFQYFGLWLFSCHLLTAYFTVRLCRLLGLGTLHTFLAVLFLCANPVLIYRGFHPSLCAHWLLIAYVYLYLLNPKAAGTGRILGSQALLLLISALLTPYLCFMVLGGSLFLALKLCFFDKVLRKVHFFTYLGASVAALLAVWYVVGMVTTGQKEEFAVAGAYGLYSLNLNALYNPDVFSNFLPKFKQVSWHQYEGYMYLGAGIFLLLSVAIAYLAYARWSPSRAEAPKPLRAYFNHAYLAPLLMLAVLYTLFSLTHIVSLNDRVLFQVPVPSPVIALGDIFRASARFFWLPYYLILLFAIVIVAKSRIRPPVRVALVAAALLVQLYDTQPMLTARILTSGAYIPPIDNKNWNALMGQFGEVVFYPPFQTNYRTGLDYQFFAFLAARARKPINVGYVARADHNAVQRMTDQLDAELISDRVAPGKLYVTTGAYLPRFSYLLQMEAVRLNTLNNYYYLFSQEASNNTLDAIARETNAGKREHLDSALAAIHRDQIEFREVSKITGPQSTSVRFNLDVFNDQERFVKAAGWAFADAAENNQGDSIFLFLNSIDKTYLAPAALQPRPDVAQHFGKKLLTHAGFEAFVLKRGIANGEYTLGIAIKDRRGRWLYQPTQQMVKIEAAYATVRPGSGDIPTGNIVWNLDRLETGKKLVEAAGWAFFKDQGTADSQIQLVLQNGNRTFFCETESMLRPDVTSHFDKKYDLDHSGFSVKIARGSVPSGTYRLGIHIRNTKTNESGMILTDKSIRL